jgi:anti-sigma factor RsiW
MDCKQWQERISLKIDGELNPQEQSLVDTHLKTCPSCAVFERSLKELRETLKKWEGIEPPLILERQLLTKILQKEREKKKREKRFKILGLAFPSYRIPAPLAWAALILLIFLSLSFTKSLFSTEIASQVEPKKIEKKVSSPEKILITAKDIKSTTTTYQKIRR